MTTTTRIMVVTWQSPGSGRTLEVCPACEAKLKAANTWPRDHKGQEYCQVSHGLHYGSCDAECHTYGR